MKRYGWLVFFVLAVPAAIAAIALGFEADKYPIATANSQAMMRIVTLLVVAGTAGGLLSLLSESQSDGKGGPNDGV